MVGIVSKSFNGRGIESFGTMISLCYHENGYIGQVKTWKATCEGYSKIWTGKFDEGWVLIMNYEYKYRVLWSFKSYMLFSYTL